MIPVYGVVALVVRKKLVRRWWSVTLGSKKVNVVRRCLISQVTHMILARANHRLLSIKVIRRLFLRLHSQAKAGRHNVSIVLHGKLAMASRHGFKQSVGKVVAL
ncbi:hypothetical protein E6C27_scaffold19G003290 [Cucumis melo var. makuwa]|uniref:Uncharacterized protein n=1 Tax=Cucumis melo var. makuwa TaxID=1194695 RepID=A0A5A7SKT6_CUCMM|nr:hypothetical protein E6C27_scaffold19G003290 [Cucumis melo var. makuwa]